jgi:hypothetical protein
LAADLTTRLADLDASLDEFDAKDTAPTRVGDLFNALLGEEAKQQRGADTVVAAIEPVSKSFDESEFADISCGALRASIQQLLAALG